MPQGESSSCSSLQAPPSLSFLTAATKPSLDCPDYLSTWGFSKGSNPNNCNFCGIHNSQIGGTMIQCGKCKCAYYCSMKCFNAGLVEHVKFCNTGALQKEVLRTEMIPIEIRPKKEGEDSTHVEETETEDLTSHGADGEEGLPTKTKKKKKVKKGDTTSTKEGITNKKKKSASGKAKGVKSASKKKVKKDSPKALLEDTEETELISESASDELSLQIASAHEPLSQVVEADEQAVHANECMDHQEILISIADAKDPSEDSVIETKESQPPIQVTETNEQSLSLSITDVDDWTDPPVEVPQEPQLESESESELAAHAEETTELDVPQVTIPDSQVLDVPAADAEQPRAHGAENVEGAVSLSTAPVMCVSITTNATDANITVDDANADDDDDTNTKNSNNNIADIDEDFDDFDADIIADPIDDDEYTLENEDTFYCDGYTEQDTSMSMASTGLEYEEVQVEQQLCYDCGEAYLNELDRKGKEYEIIEDFVRQSNTSSNGGGWGDGDTTTAAYDEFNNSSGELGKLDASSSCIGNRGACSRCGCSSLFEEDLSGSPKKEGVPMPFGLRRRESIWRPRPRRFIGGADDGCIAVKKPIAKETVSLKPAPPLRKREYMEPQPFLQRRASLKPTPQCLGTSSAHSVSSTHSTYLEKRMSLKPHTRRVSCNNTKPNKDQFLLFDKERKAYILIARHRVGENGTTKSPDLLKRRRSLPVTFDNDAPSDVDVVILKPVPKTVRRLADSSKPEWMVNSPIGKKGTLNKLLEKGSSSLSTSSHSVTKLKAMWARAEGNHSPRSPNIKTKKDNAVTVDFGGADCEMDSYNNDGDTSMHSCGDKSTDTDISEIHLLDDDEPHEPRRGRRPTFTDHTSQPHCPTASTTTNSAPAVITATSATAPSSSPPLSPVTLRPTSPCSGSPQGGKETTTSYSRPPLSPVTSRPRSPGKCGSPLGKIAEESKTPSWALLRNTLRTTDLGRKIKQQQSSNSSADVDSSSDNNVDITSTSTHSCSTYGTIRPYVRKSDAGVGRGHRQRRASMM